MLYKQIFRYVHVGYPHWSSSKGLMLKLRKKTGYSFANCKKALEVSEYNLPLAEKWLQEQAQALGWSKATKLEGRHTAQGLVAVAIERNTAAILEVNCETDFVARNKNFRMVVEVAAKSCIKFTKQKSASSLLKIGLGIDELKVLPAEDGKVLSDHVALMIGTLGENLALRRATCFQAADGVTFSGYAHPAPTSPSQMLVGKFGALIAFKHDRERENENIHAELSINEIGRQLCQHIVGMNPAKIGVLGEDVPSNNPDDEKCMIYQEYLLDPSQTVSQVLIDTGISILDFARFECGEEIPLPAEADKVKAEAEV